MSSSSTSSLRSRLPSCCWPSCCLRAFELLLQFRQRAVLQLGGLVQVVAAARPARSAIFVCSICSRRSRSCCTACFSACHWAFSASASAFRSASSFSSFASRSLRRRVLLLLQRLALDLQLHDAAVDLVQLRRHRVDLGAQLGRRLVHQVDGLVRQEAVGDVAVATAPPRPPGRRP